VLSSVRRRRYTEPERGTPATQGGSMASVYDLKPRFQEFLRPMTRRLVKAGVTANTVTMIALIGSFAVGAVVALSGGRPLLLLALPVWLFARMALTWVRC
jgi:CDP-diacylglycerol--glycerol-3-phosphate 3-phosphatidyltransferase